MSCFVLIVRIICHIVPITCSFLVIIFLSIPYEIHISKTSISYLSVSFVCYHIYIGTQTDGDEDDRDEMFEDEGPSRAIALGREFQRRIWSEGRWARLPRRLNLRPLADLRAVRFQMRIGADTCRPMLFAVGIGSVCVGIDRAEIGRIDIGCFAI